MRVARSAGRSAAPSATTPRADAAATIAGRRDVLLEERGQGQDVLDGSVGLHAVDDFAYMLREHAGIALIVHDDRGAPLRLRRGHVEV
jgi:hypothetical protein